MKKVFVAGTPAGVMNLLGVAFVVLKLCKVIDWSWWWVTAPFWGPWAVFVVLAAGIGIVGVACKVLLTVLERRERDR